MPRPPLTKVIAVLAVLAGTGWCFGFCRSFISQFFTVKSENIIDLLWDLPFPLMLSMPGIFAFYRGCRLLRRRELGDYKGVTGSLAVMCGIPICVHGERIISGEDGSGTFLLLTVTVVSIALYLPLTRWLMRRDGFATPKTGDLLGRGVMRLFAFGIWLGTNDVLKRFFINDFTTGDFSFSLLLQLITPLFLAIVFYRQASKWIEAPERRVYRTGFPVST